MSGIELIKLRSDNTNYYIRSDGNVTGFIYNPKASNNSLVEFSQRDLNEHITFDSSESTVEVYILMYSEVDVDNRALRQTNLTGMTEQARVLERAYWGTTLYIAKDEMNEEFVTSSGWAWYYILVVISAALVLLIVLIFLISCYCCRNQDEQLTENIEESTTSFQLDKLTGPVSSKKKQYFTRDTTKISGFTHNL